MESFGQGGLGESLLPLLEELLKAGFEFQGSQALLCKVTLQEYCVLSM